MKTQIKRIYAQILSLVSANLGIFGLKTGLCYPFFYCHACPASDAACPIGVVEKSIYNNSFKWKLLLFPLLILASVGVLTGRAVCGWACPIGLLQRATAKVARKFESVPIFRKIGGSRIKNYLKYFKYLNVVVLVFTTTYLFGFMFTDICPVGFLVGTIPNYLANPGLFTTNQYFWPALVIFILFLALILLVERGWCRYFCPIGAILAPFNKISFVSVEVEENKCTHCNICSDVCPMDIDVPEMDRDPECILCGKCVEICPEGAIEFRKGGKE